MILLIEYEFSGGGCDAFLEYEYHVQSIDRAGTVCKARRISGCISGCTPCHRDMQIWYYTIKTAGFMPDPFLRMKSSLCM